MRVVSLLPSASEILCSIGGGHLLVGKSHACDHPQHLLQSLPCVTSGDLATIDFDRIEQLSPDLILAGDADTLGRCSGLQAEVLVLCPATVEAVLDDLLKVGDATGLEDTAMRVSVELRGRMHSAQDFVNPYTEGPTVGFLESINPLQAPGLWTVQLIERAGGKHPWNPTVAAEDAGAAAGPQMAYRSAGKSVTVTPAQFAAEGPEYLVIAPRGLDLDQTRAAVGELAKQDWFQSLPAVKASKVALVDGNQSFNRPGPRLVDAFEFLVGFLNDRAGVIPVGFAYEVMNSM